jgi:predicted peptidase
VNTRIITPLLVGLLASAIAMTSHAVTPTWNLRAGQHPQTSVARSAQQQQSFTTDFQLYLPRGYDQPAAPKWPLIVFLHGSGERGDDIERVKLHGPPKVVQGKPDFPFIVVSPQAKAGQRWDTARLNALLDDLLERLPIDPQRIYLTGLSLGGHGTWKWAAELPGRFAAIAPVCGVGEVASACKLKDVPVWAFHGDADSVVPFAASQSMVQALRGCGGEVRFTAYPGVDHDSWTATYDNPALYEWFLQHRRSSTPTQDGKNPSTDK